MRVLLYDIFAVKSKTVMDCRIRPDRKRVIARLNQRIEGILPYVHGAVLNASLDEEKKVLAYKKGERLVTLYGDGRVAISVVKEEEIEEAVRDVEGLLSRIQREKDSIPLRREKVTVMDIYACLPRTNCKECGEPSCMAFAMAVMEGRKGAEACPGVGLK